MAERDGLGGLRADYTYGVDLLGMRRGGATSFYQYDGLGSTRLLTDGAGAVTDTYSYEGYGNLAASTGSTTNPYLFTGEQFEPATGLYNLRARNYDPTVGRFLGRDPESGRLGDPPSWHPFLYAHADPINRIDPTGRFSLIELSIATASIDSIRSSFSKNLVTKVFLPVGKIANCQLKPAFQLREAGLLMIATDVPGGELLFDTATSLIQQGFPAINQTGIEFAKSLEVKAVKIKGGGFLAKLIKDLTGGDVSSLVNATDEDRIKKLTAFQERLTHWLDDYASVVEAAGAEDDCKRWEGVTILGEKALEVLPGF